MTPTNNPSWESQSNSRQWTTQVLGGNLGFAGGDGNSQAVDATNPNRVIRYNLGNNLRAGPDAGFFFKRAFNGTTQIDLVDINHPCRTTLEGSPPVIDMLTAVVFLASNASKCTFRSGINAADSAFAGFTQIPFVLNAVPAESQRMLIVLNGLYTSTNGGDIVRNVTPSGRGTIKDCTRTGPCFHALAYGHGGVGAIPASPHVAYAGAGPDLVFRANNETEPFTRLVLPGAAARGVQIQDIVMDPTDFRTVYVVGDRGILRGTRVGERDSNGVDLTKWTSISNGLKRLIQVEQAESNQDIRFRPSSSSRCQRSELSRLTMFCAWEGSVVSIG